jgi:serine protease Do
MSGDGSKGNNTENGAEELRENDIYEKEQYRFMDQVIKKKPYDWKKAIERVLWIVISGVAIGVIAAVVFLTVLPGARKVLGIPDEKGRITIPADRDPAVTSSSSDAIGDSSEGSTARTPTPTPVPTLVPGNAAGAGEGLTIQEYKKLYQDMLKTADGPEHSLVRVIGISNDMDYFNQSYEDQKQVTGVMIAENDKDLFILTESRAVDNVQRIQVIFGDDTMEDASFQKADENTGLAVIKVPLSSIPLSTKAAFVIAPLGNSYSITKGEPVIALGNPMGYGDAAAFGLVTSVTNKSSMYDHEYSLLTTDIEGSTAGSGILVNLSGEIIGVINQGLRQEGSSTITGIAISEIKTLIQTLSNNEAVCFAGIKGKTVTEDISTRTGIPTGMLITGIAQDSPAMLAGLKEYDVIREIGGREVADVQHYSEILRDMKAGDAVKVNAMRKGSAGYAEVEFEMTLSSK